MLHLLYVNCPRTDAPGASKGESVYVHAVTTEITNRGNDADEEKDIMQTAVLVRRFI